MVTTGRETMGQARRVIAKGYRASFPDHETILKLTVVTAVYICKYTKIY